MGGDNAPKAIVEGIMMAVKEYKDKIYKYILRVTKYEFNNS